MPDFTVTVFAKLQDFALRVRAFRDVVANWAHAHKNTTAFLLIAQPIVIVLLVIIVRAR